IKKINLSLDVLESQLEDLESELEILSDDSGTKAKEFQTNIKILEGKIEKSQDTKNEFEESLTTCNTLLSLKKKIDKQQHTTSQSFEDYKMDKLIEESNGQKSSGLKEE